LRLVVEHPRSKSAEGRSSIWTRSSSRYLKHSPCVLGRTHGVTLTASKPAYDCQRSVKTDKRAGFWPGGWPTEWLGGDAEICRLSTTDWQYRCGQSPVDSRQPTLGVALFHEPVCSETRSLISLHLLVMSIAHCTPVCMDRSVVWTQPDLSSFPPWGRGCDSSSRR